MAFTIMQSLTCFIDHRIDNIFESMVRKLNDQKKLKDDPKVLPLINNADMEMAMESIKDYLWKC